MTTSSHKLRSGGLKTYTFGNTLREIAYTPAINLPTSEPANPQVSFTVQNSDIPATNAPGAIGNIVSIYLSGKNSKLVAGTISFIIYKNGVQVVSSASGSIATTQNYFNIIHWRWKDVVPGDVLEVKLWSTQAGATDVYLDYANLRIVPNFPAFLIGKMLTDVEITTGSLLTPTLTDLSTGTIAPTVWALTNTSSYYVFLNDGVSTNGNALALFSTGVCTFKALAIGAKSVKCSLGDETGFTSSTYSHTGLRQYQVQQFMSKISFRELR